MDEPSRAELWSFIEACPVGLLEFDDAGHVRYMNPVARHFLELAAPDAEPEDFLGVMDRQLPNLRRAFAAFTEPSGEIVERQRFVVRDANRAEIAFTMRLVRIEPGRNHCLIADISPFLQERRRRIAAEGRLAGILESIRDYAFYTLDLSGTIDAWNRSGERLLRFQPGDVIGKRLDFLYAEENQAPLDMATLLTEVRQVGSHRVEGWWRRRHGSAFWGDAQVSVIRDENGHTGSYSVVTRDLSSQRAIEERLRRIADTDALTGLLSRRAFEAAADHQLSERLRDDRSISLALVDVDWFKTVNDTWGHPVGDAGLRHVARVLEASVRIDDMIGRIGGDELAILLPHTGLEAARAVAERVRSAVARSPYQAAGATVPLSVSIGLTEARSGETREQLMARADAALYAAKSLGRDRVVVTD